MQKYGRPELFIGGGSLGHASRKVMHQEGVVDVPVGATLWPTAAGKFLNVFFDTHTHPRDIGAYR